MNMMNKCAKFHKDSSSGKKGKFHLPNAIELLETADFGTTLYRNPMQTRNFGGTFDQTRRSQPSVSKVISQPRSLGGRRLVDRAAGAALRLIDLTHVRVYSKATHDDFFFCFLRSNDRTKLGVFLLSFLLRSLRLTKTVLKPKKGPCKRSSRLSGGLLVSEFFQSEKQRSLDDKRRRSDD